MIVVLIIISYINLYPFAFQCVTIFSFWHFMLSTVNILQYNFKLTFNFKFIKAKMILFKVSSVLISGIKDYRE